MGKHYSERQRNLAPSLRTYKKHIRVPEGCVDVWRINVVDTVGNVSIHSQHWSRTSCMQIADDIHNTRVLGTGAVAANLKKIFTKDGHPLRYVYVEHKAAIQIGDKFHIVNIPSFTFTEPPRLEQAQQSLLPDLDHKRWLAEFEGRPPVSDPGEGIHNEINYEYPDE